MTTLPIRLAAASFLTILLGCAGTASAAIIIVTTKNDVVADDGRCSLREAVSAANKNVRSGTRSGECPPGDGSFVDLIQLRRETYELERTPIGEDQNAGGDLDVTGSVVIQGKGRRTIVANGLGNPEVVGDGDRIFHVDPTGAGGVDVIFSRLTLARGDVGCTGEECDTGGSAVDGRGSGSLTFEGCTILRNTATCFGEGCGTYVSGSPIQTAFGGSVKIRNTTIKKNATWCTTDRCSMGGAAIGMNYDDSEPLVAELDEAGSELVLDGSEVTQNESWCQGTACSVTSTVTGSIENLAVRAVAFTLNTSVCYGETCSATGIVDAYADGRTALLEDVQMSDNTGYCSGTSCYAGAVLYVGADGSAALRRASLTNNSVTCEGAGCYVGIHYAVFAEADATLEEVALSSETVACHGDDCKVSELLYLDSDGSAVATDVRISTYFVECEGASCEVDGIATVGGGIVETANTTLEAMLVGCSGADCEVGSLANIYARGDASVTRLTVRSAFFGCQGEDCSTGHPISLEADGGALRLTEPSLESNRLTCSGPTCFLADMLGAYATTEIVLQEPNLFGNRNDCLGEQCRAGGLAYLQADQLTVDGGEMSDNQTHCESDFCRVPAVFTMTAREATISRSSIDSNAATCSGEECAAGPGGALRATTRKLTVTDTTLRGNRTDGYGAAIFNDAGSELRIDRSLLADNEAGLRGTMEFGGFGGAVFNDAASGQIGVIRLGDTTIRNNRALRSGGGILNEGTIAQLANSTITGNSIGDCVNRGGTGCP